jgi:RHS repeat-associated protein
LTPVCVFGCSSPTQPPMKRGYLSYLLLAFCTSGSLHADPLSTSAVSVGAHHGLALRSDGSVWSWGTNAIGELGLGTNSQSLSPKRISSLSNMAAISAGPLHSLAVATNGQAWAWGNNVDGRLGSGNFLNASNPVPVSLLTNVISVSAGVTHSLAVLADGHAVAWGANPGGQLGSGNTVGTNRPEQVLTLTNIVAVSAGSNFSLALTAVGDVWSWGTNNAGQLGLGNNTAQSSPQRISTLSNIVQIAAGNSHALALDQNGLVYAWGRNTEGELGDGTVNSATSPKQVPSFGPTGALGKGKWIAANFNSSAAVSTSGRLFYWGYYGNGTSTGTVTQPAELSANGGLVFSTVTYGDGFLLAGQPDGSVWAWGYNLNGNWGNGFTYSAIDTWRYEKANIEFSFGARPTPFMTRFNRGDRYNYDCYCSFVMPLDLEQGVRLDAQGSDLYSYGATTPWFLQVQKTTRYHSLDLVGGTTNLTRFVVDNPVAAYGSDAGGSPLYTGMPYRFGLFGGAYDENAGQTAMIRVQVYARGSFTLGATNVAPTNSFTITLPRRDVSGDNAAWSSYVTNGNRLIIETNGLRTVVEFQDSYNSTGSAFNSWGLDWNGFAANPNVMLVGYKLTHTASSTNYCYIIEALGSVVVGNNVTAPMSLNTNSAFAYTPIYALGFDTFPAWRSHFIDNPHFEGIALPPEYAGRRASELNGLTAVITNNIWITNNSLYTNLDNSPELRRHPILDQFVQDMGNNPLALANYVINEIDLTDPMGLQESSKQVADSIEIGGVNRSALNVFLEGQGSPAEQCALLVYLLRQAGYPAAYVFPTNSNMRLLDTKVSQLWQMNVHGVIYFSGIPVITNSLIMVNYPWVIANIGTNSVQIFPWLKDTEIVEGQNIYNYLPTNYPTAYSWIKDYALANPQLMALASPNDGMAKTWQQYLYNVINTNQLQSNLSLDDFGVRAFNRRNSYPTWSRLPLPNFFTNQSQVAVVSTLSDSSVTYPFLTNMFDRIRIEVFHDDTNTANRIFDTGQWRACDLHNRKLLLYTNGLNTASLWLAAYRTNITSTTNFQNIDTGLNSLYTQVVTASIASTVSNLPVRITYQRRDSTLASPTSWFPMAADILPFTNLFTCHTRDVTAILPGVARVTPDMLQVHAEDYWRLQQQRALNPNFNPAVTDDAGDAAILLASSFFNKVWNDDAFNQRLHKIRAMTWNSCGVAALTRLSSSKMQLTLNMNWFADLVLGNASLRQDSADRGFSSLNNYMAMLQGNASSAEHSVIYSLFGDGDAVSTIRLLQLAAQRGATNGWAQPMELNLRNYITLGNGTYSGYGGTALKSQDATLWQKVTNVFVGQWDSNYYRVLITPGPVTNNTASFKGMSCLNFGEWNTGAIMSDNGSLLNGGYSSSFSWIGSPTDGSTYVLSYDLDYSPSLGYSFVLNNFGAVQPHYNFSQYDLLTLTATSGVAKVAFTPQQTLEANLIAGALNLPAGSTASIIQSGKNSGWMGRPWTGMQQPKVTLYDPVDIVSGDFCADTEDMALPGPMPLSLRRNYQSRSLPDDQFGPGWKLSIMPWLVLTTNANNESVIYAAELDGAVLAYHYQSNNFWAVLPKDNPTLANFTTAGIGSTANQFNNQIQLYTTNGTLYLLKSPLGDKRYFQVMTNFSYNSGTNHLTRIRPYLTRWEDHASNYYAFSYGTNAAADDFGQLSRIDSANGASLILKYDIYGRITDAYTDDSRHVQYQYDNYGDLVTVILPDFSSWQYQYEHYTFTTNSQNYTDSDHLLVAETKPNGRLLANTYDSLRRVIQQAASVGTNRELVTNAWFFYTNDCVSLTNDLINGLTRVEDVFHNPSFYYYTNSLLDRIEEPLGHTNIQNWYDATETNKSGYYPQSLEYTVDARGLTNQFYYNSQGNISSRVASGDLAGDGTVQTATNAFTYTNNLPATWGDPVGNQMAFYYEDPLDAFRPTRLELSNGGVGITTNRLYYSNVTQTMDLGGWLKTNSAFGVLSRLVRADAATNEWSYDGRGFLTQSVQYARTADYTTNPDPPVTNFYTFTARGDLSEQSDALGRRARMGYDDVGRMQWRDVLDENGNAVARENFYYNRDGELEWYDGPRSSPEDFIWFSYDGAGRKTQEIHWRSRAKADGTGVEAETGDALYATSFFQYDPFGNQIQVTDPRGNFVQMDYNALGQLSRERFYAATTGAGIGTNGFGYELGGLISSSTNSLGGVMTRLYTSGGQLKYQSNPDGSTNAWRFDLAGRRVKSVLPNGSYWQTVYADASRSASNVLFSAAGTPLATNSLQYDRRGNQIMFVDEGGNHFTNLFDGLDRIKIAAGPVISVVGLNMDLTTYTTNNSQQLTMYFYDGSGQTLTSTNGLGEKIVSVSDVLGRPTQLSAYAPGSATAVRVTTYAYGTNNNSVSITNGTGANAIASTVYTDNDGNPALSIGYPSAGTTEFALQRFDVAGNRVAQQQCSSAGGAITIWATNGWTYDGLNRPIAETNRDGVFTVYTRDGLGNVLSRSMPGGLSWTATYYNDGRIATEQESGGASTTRSITYQYYAAGNPFAGLLYTVTDGRNTTKTYNYDNFLRLSGITTTGTAGEQQTSTTYQYDSRGLLTSSAQSFNSTNTGPSTSVQRQLDVYGQTTSESVAVANSGLSLVSQTWDAAGRRTMLNFAAQNYGFIYQADGLMLAADGSTFGYANNGLLTGRTNNYRTYVIAQRDGMGRVLQALTKVFLSTNLTENLAWRNDGRLTGYTAVRLGDFTDSRTFSYSPFAGRLTQEVFNVSSSQQITNNYAYDFGQAGGLGVLTSLGSPAQSTNTWSALSSGGLDGFGRVAKEQTAILRRPATGLALGAANVSATFDGNPVGVQFDGTDAEGRWRATLDMASGPHTLRVAAVHPSGQYTAYATNTFTTTGGADTVTNVFDGNGNVTQRTWIGSNGQTNRTQTLTWSAFDRLIKVTERDSVGSGQNWVAIFDALGRKVRTITTLVVSNTPITSPTNAVSTVDSWYDPEVEFQEVGVVVNGGVFNMKTYGPDANGVHGGLEGVGGLERVTPFGHISGIGLLQDYFGNIVGSVTNATSGVTWNPARFSSYGPVPGYQQSALTQNANLAQAVGWRGKWVESVGTFYWAARPYDPAAAHFVSADPWSHASSLDLYSAFAGDPANFFDPDGRIGKQWIERSEAYQGNVHSVGDFFAAVSYGVGGIALILPGTLSSTANQVNQGMAEARSEINGYTGGKAVLARSLQLMGGVGSGNTTLVLDPVHTAPSMAKGLVTAPINFVGESYNFATSPSVNNAFNAFEQGLATLTLFEGAASVHPRLNPANYSVGGRLFSGVPSLRYTGRFPEWRPGNSITQLTPEGNYPGWATIRSRYWQNRALADPQAFGAANRAIMEKGFAPKARVVVRDRSTGLISERLVEKELHHANGNRGVPGFDDPISLREVWPWEHESLLPPGRRLDYDFIRFNE